MFDPQSRHIKGVKSVVHVLGARIKGSARKVSIIIIIIIISLFQEDNTIGTNASLTYGPRLQR